MTRFELLGLPYNSMLTIKNGSIKAIEMPEREDYKVRKMFHKGDKFKFIKMNVKLNFVLGELDDGKVYKFKLKKLLKFI